MILMSLRAKIILSFILFILIPVMCVGFLAYFQVENVLHDQITVATSDRLHQTNINIENKLNAMKNASRAIILDDNISNILLEPPQTPSERMQAVKHVNRKYLEVTTSIITTQVYLTLLDNEGNMYTNWSYTSESYQKIFDSEWMKQTLLQDGFMVWTLNHQSYVHPEQEKLVTTSMKVKSQDFSKTIGTLVISQPVDSFIEILKARNRSVESYGFIVSEEGELLGEHPTDLSEVYRSLSPALEGHNKNFNWDISGEKSFVSMYTIPLTNWQVVQVLPYDNVFNDIKTIRNTAVIITITSMVIFVILVIFFSNMFTRPLRELRQKMTQVEQGNLDVAVTIQSHDEIGILGKSFNKMVSRLRHHIQNEILLQKSKEKAKLEALQAQINPHFLHNTLNTIKWMSIMAGTQKITEMLLSLGRLLDMSIHRERETITLEEEMDNVRAFITIQQYRFGNKVRIVENIDPGTWNALVPKLSLQPLVENVYQHGVSEGDEIEMTIHSRIDKDILYLEVQDNGIGLSEERMKELLEVLQNKNRESFSRTGLFNVHKRIQLLFGESFGLIINRDKEHSITRVVIKLPLRRNSDGGSSRGH